MWSLRRKRIAFSWEELYGTECQRGYVAAGGTGVSGICTFQREKEVRRDVGLILDRLIECSESCLYHHAQVFISDNGQTLETDEFHNDRVHIFPNVNAGGAGGFTRTMIESVYRSGENFTHIILMDDDIELYPPVIERTYRLLQMMKDEWARAVVGGACWNW